MAYIQKLICSNSNYLWNEQTIAQEANEAFIADIEIVTTDEEIQAFQQAFAAVHAIYFDEDLQMVDGKLHVLRSWKTLEDYNAYKAAIRDIEDAVNAKMESAGWTIEESINQSST